VPAYVDGQMLAVAESAGGRVINRDRMWHYPEGVTNADPAWPLHGIRILPGPSSVWLDARGERLPAPLFPGFDSLGTLAHLARTGHDYSWLVLNQRIFAKEIALAGSEHNPDLTGRSLRQVLGRAGSRTAPAPVEALKRQGVDVAVAATLPDLVRRMNGLAGESLLDAAAVERLIVARDREVGNGFAKDAQVTAIRGARRYRGDRLFRVARPHRILDPAAGPLVAVRLSVLTRKTLGGLATDLSGRVLTAGGGALPGLYAAGEAAGFGGGGMHGYRALEGTFLGGCLFSGRAAGRAAGAQVI
jgi:predicted oxidoreductase